VTPDAAPIPNQAPSTAGMTNKVVKGSLWTLAGQVAPLGVSLIATPFVIRMLGAEGYGVLILVGLIPNYLGFADFGMGIASTKFASEAYAAGDSEKEARTVRTAALIALIGSVPVAAAIFFFSNTAITAFNVPPELHSEANLALKLASVTFVIGFLNNIFNTPQLTRLRMDLNTFVNSGFRMLGLLATPIVIYLGGGILGAVAVLLIVTLLTLAAHLYVSGKLLNQLFQFTVDRSLIRPMLKFGGALLIALIAAGLLMHVEKIILTTMTSVETLAHYSVAFTFSTMATMFAAAMMQALIPAFSQLLSPEKEQELGKLFTRAIRINVILMLPCLTALFIIARPFFTTWAGEEFGRESAFPFQILLFGLFFSIVAYVPLSLLIASGRTALMAKVYWCELVIYVVLVVICTWLLGAVGTAIAYSVRVIGDSFIVSFFSIRERTSSLSELKLILTNNKIGLLMIILTFAPAMAISMTLDYFSPLLMIWLCLSMGIYALIIWKKFLEASEKIWTIDLLKNGRISFFRILR